MCKDKMMLRGATLLLAIFATSAHAAERLRPDQTAFFDLYKTLIETNTTLSEGSCTLAAERMAARLRAAGLPESQLTLFADPAHPKEGGLVAVYPGTSKTLKPILLLAHIDVVEARREDWTRDPFTLVEEGDYLYGRGTLDDKAMASVWVDTLGRFQQAGTALERTVKVALTCGEETNGAFNGAQWLASNQRALIDAEFALNEGGGGRTDGHGKLVRQNIQIGEKTFANYRVESRNAGGHSSMPRADNAIYQLAHALARVEAHVFPVEFTEITRTFFREGGAARKDALGDAMIALADNPADKAAAAAVDADPYFSANLRTTCVATMLDGGHAPNALAQRAGANINCRIFPGHSVASIRDELAAIIDDPAVSVTALPPLRPEPPLPPLDAKVVGPMKTLAAKHFRDVPVLISMAIGYTDATFLGAVGIPTYGVPGLWADPDSNGVHGLNERIEARSLFAGRDYLFDLVTTLAR